MITALFCTVLFAKSHTKHQNKQACLLWGPKPCIIWLGWTSQLSLHFSKPGRRILETGKNKGEGSVNFGWLYANIWTTSWNKPCGLGSSSFLPVLPNATTLGLDFIPTKSVLPSALQEASLVIPSPSALAPTDALQKGHGFDAMNDS